MGSEVLDGEKMNFYRDQRAVKMLLVSRKMHNPYLVSIDNFRYRLINRGQLDCLE